VLSIDHPSSLKARPAIIGESAAPVPWWDGPTDTPGSVIARRHRRASGGHPSTNAVADALQRPTRALGRAALITRTVWPCSGWGLPSHAGHPACWWSLTPPFHPYPRARRGLQVGGFFSVALACGLPRVGVTHHPALRSPDVPRWSRYSRTVQRGRLVDPSAIHSRLTHPRIGHGPAAQPVERTDRTDEPSELDTVDRC